MPLDDLEDEENGEEGSMQETKTTSITLKNPEHDDVELEGDDLLRNQREFYEAALYVRRVLGSDINIVVGEFLNAVRELHQNDDPELLHQVAMRLMQDNPYPEDQTNPFAAETVTQKEKDVAYHTGYNAALTDVALNREGDNVLHIDVIQNMGHQNMEELGQKLSDDE